MDEVTDGFFQDGKHFDADRGDRLITLAEQLGRAVYLMEKSSSADGHALMRATAIVLADQLGLEGKERTADYAWRAKGGHEVPQQDALSVFNKDVH